MSAEKFLTVSYFLSTKTVAVSQISSVEPFMMGAKITLKEIKNGENVTFNTPDDYNAILLAINRLNQ